MKRVTRKEAGGKGEAERAHSRAHGSAHAPARGAARGCDPMGMGMNIHTGGSPGSRARAREGFYDPAITDQVDAAVDEAMAQTGGSRRFRRAWCFYCLHLGINTFLDQLDCVMSCMRQGEIRYPARAFHARLRRIKNQIDGRKV